MLDTTLTPLSEPFATQAAGTVLLHRGDAADRIVHVLQGKVIVGVMTDGDMAHQLGVVEGPFWLEAASGLLGLPHAVDAVAETEVHLQFVNVPDFLASSFRAMETFPKVPPTSAVATQFPQPAVTR